MSWVPNLVTASRGAFGIAAAIAVLRGDHLLSFWLFLVGILTDLVDGPIAKALRAQNALGEALDPLADKVLVNACWIALWWRAEAPGWLVWTLLFRDTVVVVGHTLALRRGIRWRANRLGRIAVSFEGVAVAVLLFHGPWLGVHWPTVGVTLGAITLCFSLASALDYARTGPPPDEGT